MVETDSFGSLSITLNEYGIADRAYELNRKAAEIAKEVAHGFTTPDTPPVGGRLHRPRHQVPVPRPDPLRRDARRLRGAGPGPPRRRRRPAHHRDRLRPPPGQDRHRRLPAGHGRRRPPGAHPGPGHHRAHRAHAARHRDRRRPHRPRRHAARRHRPQLRHRPGRDARAPPPPLPALPGADLVPAQRRPAVGGRRQDALRPHPGPAGRVPPRLRHRAGRERHRRLLRHHARAPQGRHRPLRGPQARPPQPRPRAGGGVDLHRTSRSSRTRRSWSWASAPTPTGRRSSARPCWPADWDTCVAMARDQVKEGAHVLDVCVDYTGENGVEDMDEIAAASPPRPACPSSSTPPSRPSSRPPCSGSAARPSSTRSTWRTATPPAPASTASFAWPGSTGRPSSARASTRRARPAPPSGSCGRPRPSTTSPSTATAWSPSDLLFDPLALPLSTGMEESRRDGIETIKGIELIKAELPGRVHHPRPVERVVRAHAGRPPRPQLGLPQRVRRGRARRRHRPRGPDHAPQQDPRGAAQGLPRPGLRPAQAKATTRCRSCWSCSRGCRRRRW